MVRSIHVIHPWAGQNYGPGREPQTVRDAYDRHLQAQQEAEATIAARAGAGAEAEVEIEIG
jgi:hypothetical protein